MLLRSDSGDAVGGEWSENSGEYCSQSTLQTYLVKSH